MSELPHFPFRRDAASVFDRSDAVCACCRRARGHVLNDSTMGELKLCPWCIADGQAAQRLGVRFFDADFCDDNLDLVHLAAHWHATVFERTPGFACFNPIGWWVHCGEPAEYLRRDEPYDLVFECRHCRRHQVVQDLD